MDAGLKRALEAKISAGERLSRSDGIALYASDDLAWLGRLAHHQRTELNGDRVTFAVNRSLSLAGPDADEVVSAARELGDRQLTEVHLVDAVSAGRPWSAYPEMLRRIRQVLPGVGIRGFGASGVQLLEEVSGRSAAEVLDELTEAGLGSLTSTGDDDGGPDWWRIHRLAHDRGMTTPAAMRYGHGEEPAHRVDHVLRLREQQDETGGFASFVLHRSDHDGSRPAPAASLKTFAVSRLLFDNVPHLEGSWSTHDRSVVQLALNFGADEIQAPDTAGREEVLDLIWDAGFRPVERDIRYAVVREHDAAPSFADRRREPQQVWA